MSNKETIGEMRENKTHCFFEWKISKFSSLCHTGNPYYSPSFTAMNNSLYLLLVVPDSHYDFISVYLQYKSGVTVSFSIKKSDGTLLGSETALNGMLLIHGTKTVKETYYVDFEFLNRSALQSGEFELLPEDSLIISCDLKFDLLDGKHTLPPAVEANTLKEVPEHKRLTETDLLSKNFKDLLSNKDSCDAVLLVQGKEFKVHKSVLIARSSVFAAMFQHNTDEKETGKVVIPDCDPDSFQEFLEYLYCGKLEDISSNSALHLYYTSDKYNLLELKTFCTKYLIHNLTLQNVCDVICLADKYDETNLLSAVQDFFNKNPEEIFKTSEWEYFIKNNFHLANKFLIEMPKVKK